MNKESYGIDAPYAASQYSETQPPGLCAVGSNAWARSPPSQLMNGYEMVDEDFEAFGRCYVCARNSPWRPWIYDASEEARRHYVCSICNKPGRTDVFPIPYPDLLMVKIRIPYLDLLMVKIRRWTEDEECPF